ncbi:MAG: hypothetical protein RL885_12595 [Planctomycetota bacterium]
MSKARTKAMTVGTILALAYLATQPPILGWVNRVEPDWNHVPFVVLWLSGAYLLFLAGLLLWVWRRG